MSIKRILFSVLSFFAFIAGASAAAEAGDIAKIWTYPVVYNFDEQVSWYFDLSSTSFVDGSDVYIWTWSPSEPDAGNWENSSDFAKLTYVGNSVYRFDITPTVYYSKTSAEIAGSAGFWFRLKDKTGSLQSSVHNVPITDFSAFMTSGKVVDVYPAKFYKDQPLSILFNSTLAPGFTNPASIHLHAGVNNWDMKQEYQAWLPEITAKTKFVDMGNGLYRKDLIPNDYFALPDGYVMTNLVGLMVATDWSATTTPDFSFTAAGVVPPPPPALTLFPIKVSVKDVFVMIRTNNLPSQKLNYSLSDEANITVTGEFAGNMAQQDAFVDLNKAFGASTATKLKLIIKDLKGSTIYDNYVFLTTVD